MSQDRLVAALRRIARIVAETLELGEVLVRVAEEAKAVLPLHSMWIVRQEDSGRFALHSSTVTEVPRQVRSVLRQDVSPALLPQQDTVKRFRDIGEIADPSYLVDGFFSELGVRSLMTAPLKRGEQTVGFLSVYSREVGAFLPDHEHALLSIADILALALEHQRLANLDAVRRLRVDAVDALFPVIANALDIREIFESVSAVVKPLLPHDHLVLFTSSPDEKTINIEAYSGDSTGELPASAPRREYRWLPSGKELHIIEDVAAIAPRGLDEPLVKVLGIRAAFQVPIYLEGAPKSTLNFWSRSPKAYSVDDIPVARRVADLVSLALSHKRLSEEEHRAALLEARVESLTKELETTLGLRRIVGASKKWREILGHVARVAPTETTVLLTGESGTGKEVLARMIHRESPRANGPFVAVNCAALPENLLESELFGHERGAFTGATTAHSGRIEQATGGVLFLDEVGEMSLAVQAKVLRVIEQREFTKVGGGRLLKADVRLIAATNRNLRERMARGEFREDLYYRLRVFEITAPSLRERKEDILLLAEAFLEEVGVTVGRPAAGFSGEVREALVAYRWPGNVRELRNVLERATILCDGGLIGLEHLPPEITPREAPDHGPVVSAGTGLNLKQTEGDLLQRALREAGGNRAKAARLLGISRPTLYYRLRKQGLL